MIAPYKTFRTKMRYGTTETKNTYEPQTISPSIYWTDGHDDVAYSRTTIKVLQR